jgi:hypothetical protein
LLQYSSRLILTRDSFLSVSGIVNRHPPRTREPNQHRQSEPLKKSSIASHTPLPEEITVVQTPDDAPTFHSIDPNKQHSNVHPPASSISIIILHSLTWLKVDDMDLTAFQPILSTETRTRPTATQHRSAVDLQAPAGQKEQDAPKNGKRTAALVSL